MNENQYASAKDAYYEALIKQALEEILRKEADDLLPNDAFEDKIVFSDRHERRMKALFARYRRREFMHRAIRIIGKTAAVILVLLGIAFSALLLNPQVRAAVKQFFIETYDQFMRFNYSSDISSQPDSASWYPGWLPEGYMLESEREIADLTRKIYSNEQEDIIMLRYLTDAAATLNNDNENRSFDLILREGLEYYYGVSEIEPKTNQVIWAVDETKFTLESTVDFTVLLEIAASIKK